MRIVDHALTWYSDLMETHAGPMSYLYELTGLEQFSNTLPVGFVGRDECDERDYAGIRKQMGDLSNAPNVLLSICCAEA